MAPKDRLTPYACIGLALVSFALLSAIVAEPVLRLVWTPQVTIAHNGAGGSRQGPASVKQAGSPGQSWILKLRADPDDRTASAYLKRMSIPVYSSRAIGFSSQGISYSCINAGQERTLINLARTRQAGLMELMSDEDLEPDCLVSADLCLHAFP